MKGFVSALESLDGERARRIGENPADDRDGAGRDGRAAIGNESGVGVEGFDALVRETEGLGHDLGEDRARPLSHLRRRRPDAHETAGEKLHSRDRGEVDFAAAGEAGAVEIAGQAQAAPLRRLAAIPGCVGAPT